MITEGAISWNDYMEMGNEDREWLLKACKEIQEQRKDDMRKSSRKG